MTRGQLLSPLWASANAYQLAQTPPRPVIVRGAVTQAVFQTKLNALPSMNQAVKTAEEVLNRERGALRRAARDLETLCIRFLKAATGLADEGSAEATALATALATIPTQTTSDLPETLGIQTFTQGGSGGLELLVAYEPYALEPDETAILQYQVLDVDVDWQSTPYDASGNALGPFTVGQTVKVRTRVTNPHGSRDGGPRQLTLIAPPA